MTHSLLKSLMVIITDQDIDAKLLWSLSSQIQNIYDPNTLPITIPLWPNPPDDIPMMIFNSPDGHSLQIKKRRFEFIYQPPLEILVDADLDTWKIESIVRILKDESIPFTKYWVVIDVLGNKENPNTILVNLNTPPFSEQDNKEPDLSYTLSKTTKKTFATFWSLLYRLYLDTSLINKETWAKYYLFGIDMNNIDAGENISTSDKIVSFTELVYKELKTNLTILESNN